MIARLVVAASLVSLLALGCEAFSSSFAGSFATISSRQPQTSRRGQMEMRAMGKRGQARSPPRLRHDYSHRADERDWNSDQFDDHAVGKDGVPALNLFVRERHGHSDWLPCGNMISDEATTHLVNYYRDSNSDAARKELDDILTKSLAGAWEANTVIDDTIFAVYPQLRKKQSELEFGYKISHENLSKEQAKIHVLGRGRSLHP